MHAYEVHAREIHAHGVHACETHAFEHAYEGFYEDLARQNTVARLFLLATTITLTPYIHQSRMINLPRGW